MLCGWGMELKMKLKSFFSPFKKPRRHATVLEEGKVDPLCLGTQYSQNLLMELYDDSHGKKILLSLTPICQYQILNKWPEPPFVNVNLHGSLATERNNWLGYISIEDPTDIDFNKLMDDYGQIDVVAKIRKTGREYYIQFFISEEYIPTKIKKTYISHTKDQIEFLSKLAGECGKDYVPISVKKEAKKYTFLYDNAVIGTASCKKIDSIIGANALDKVSLFIKKFRFVGDKDVGEYENNYNYSTIYITLA